MSHKSLPHQIISKILYTVEKVRRPSLPHISQNVLKISETISFLRKRGGQGVRVGAYFGTQSLSRLLQISSFSYSGTHTHYEFLKQKLPSLFVYERIAQKKDVLSKASLCLTLKSLY